MDRLKQTFINIEMLQNILLQLNNPFCSCESMHKYLHVN